MISIKFREKRLYNILEEIKALKEKLLDRASIEFNPDKETELGRKGQIRDIRAILKEKITTYNLISEAEKILKYEGEK